MSPLLNRGRAAIAWAGTEPRLLSYLLFLVVVLAVWLPGGFNIGPINDGWIDLTSHIWISGEVGTRVFQYVPRALGLALSPGNFVGWQLLLLVLTLARAALVYEILLRLLDGQHAYALACGLFALFHPMDYLYFWVDASNVDMAYALALAACLAALAHLRSGSRAALAACWVLQLLSCFTYTGFVPILAAFPALIWLLWKLDGRPAAPVYLLKSTILVILFVVVMALEARYGQNRESRVASFNLVGVMQGYAYELRTLGSGWLAWATAFQSAYLLPAAVAGGVGLGVAWRTAVSGQDGRAPPRFHALLALMLLVLAAVAYLPYAVSELRIGNERQMLAAGLFLLMALLLPPFLWLSHTPLRRRVAAVLVALLAVGTVITGTEMRSTFLDRYRAQEGLLASIAAAVPDPPAHSFILVESVRELPHIGGLAGLANRPEAFSTALQYMYGDDSLAGILSDQHNRATLTQFTPEGVTAAGSSVPYSRLILLQYQADGSVHPVDANALRQQAPAGADLSAYRAGPDGDGPGPHSDVCRMLQSAYRPAYCR